MSSGLRPSVGQVLFLATLAAALALGPRDDDLYWHLEIGRQILSGHIPHANLYSFTAPDHPWVHPNWLGSALLAAVEQSFGWRGLTALSALLFAVFVTLAYDSTKRLSASPARGLLVGGAAAFFLLAGYTARPMLVGHVCLTITVWLLVVRPRWLSFGLPVLFVFWANLHGSYPFGLLLVAAAVVEHIWRRQWPAARVLGLGLAASLATCAITPYGTGTMLVSLHYAWANAGGMLGGSDGHLLTVAEWHGVRPPSLLFAAWALGALAGLRVLARSILPPIAPGHETSRRSACPTLAVLAFLLAVPLPLISVRHLPIFAALATMLWAQPASASCSWVARLALADSGARLSRWVVALCTAGLLVLSPATPPGNPGTSGETRFFPRPALAWLARQPTIGGGRLFVDYNWSGAAILVLVPRYRVFLDARHECYPTTILADYLRIHAASRDSLGLLRSYAVDVALVESHSPLARRLSGWPGLRLATRLGSAAVFVKP